MGAADAGLLGHLEGRGALAADFRPAQQEDLAPAGLRAKAHANLAALEVLAALRAEGRPADPAEQTVLARWSGWGALPGVFDEGDTTWSALRGELRRHLDRRAWDAARRTVLNAHYSPAEVAGAIWTAVTELGFIGGRVLEPGCGSGNFIGLAPQGVPLEMVGVELDPTTAAIAQALYPTATIRAEGFETSRFPDEFFDLTVGNVPFAKVAMHDPQHNPGRLTLHNHFIVKSLALTRPGGLVAVVTSRFTLDARNPAARRTMSELADLVGALRLPAGALRAAAGTDAISDVLILRRREPDRAPSSEAWEHVVPVAIPDPVSPRRVARHGQGMHTSPLQSLDVTVNEYFARHPDRILGELRASGGQYSATDLDVIAGPEALAERLTDALRHIVVEAQGAGLGWVPRRGAAPTATAAADLGRSHKEGAILLAGPGRFSRVVNGVAEPFEPKPAKDRAELAALLGLRDAVTELFELEATSRDDEACSAARRTLNERYDAYAARWGPLNRFSLVRTGRVDPDSGEARFRQARPSMGGFRADPDARSVMALEVFDPETQTAIKAAVFHRRVVAPREPRRGADTAQDALAICLDERGRVDLDVISGLLGVDVATARSELGELVWDDPQTGQVVPAAEYLSGDVRSKLAAAEAAATTYPRSRANVEALARVVPADLGPAEIDARLGAPWIPTGDVARFIAEVLGPTAVVEYVPVTATWAVQVPSWQRHTVAVTSTWGTSRADAISLVVASLNQRPVSVYDATDDGRRILNPAETLAAREKQGALEERFAAWVWEDPTRSQRLAEEYNRLFNSTVLPAYDGAHLTLPGLAADFRPHAHQRDAVWRILSQPTVLLAHDVGAGKTATMAMAAMELRRLGLVHKPAFVVPNHMLDQFSRELAQLYPRARILVAERDDTSAAARREFVARCATGDWEAVVITASTFGRIPVSAPTRIGFVEKRIAELRQAAAESKEGLTVKRLEAHIARMEQRHERLLAASEKDDGVRFEETGIDYLFVDEAHHFKNRPFATNIAGVGGQGSQRAEDLEMKLDYLRSRHGARVATFATATPVANSLAEMWVMQTYLQPHRLAAGGVASFDAWAATFGRTVTALELAPDGGSYRLSTRFARFRNVPELLTMFRETADVRSAAQLALKVPAVKGGQPSTVVVAASDQLSAYVAELVDRAERVRSRLVRPDEDNMLKISGDGRRAALDLRLVGQAPDPAGGKIAAAASRIAAIHATHRDATYADPWGQPAPRPGALQVVFCDLGTPQPDGRWSVYEELRSQLALRGVPPSMVRFVHEAGDDRAKAELFAACRDGRVAVLVGSTEKMGVGTNVQARLVALHHLDCPWRPADIAQREGRALRQGNQNPEVEIVRYVTESSFDVFMWQTVERKAAFVHQVMASEVTGREVDDIGDTALSYAEVKALATGNPLILEKAGVDNELARLTRLQHAHDRDQTRLARTLTQADTRAARLDELAAQTNRAITRRVDTTGERFSITIGKVTHHKRADGGTHLKHLLAAALAAGGVDDRSASPQAVAFFAGFPLEVSVRRDASGPFLVIGVADTPIQLLLTPSDLAQADAQGLVSRLEHRLRSLKETRDNALADRDRLRQEAAAAKARIGIPFPHTDRIGTLQRRQAEIERELLPELDTDVVPTEDSAPSSVATQAYPDSPPSGRTSLPSHIGASPTQHPQPRRRL